MDVDFAEEVLPLSTDALGVLDAMPAQVALLDRNGRIVAVNAVWWRSLAAMGESGSPIGQNYLSVCESATSDDSSRRAAEGIRRVLNGELAEFEHEYTCPTAQGLWFLLRVTPWSTNSRRGAILMHIDVTARRKVLDQLHESQALLAEAQQVSHVGSFSWWPATNRIEWSEEMYRIWGQPVGSPISMQTVFELIHPEDRALVAETTARAKETGGQAVTFRIVRGDGTIATLRANGREERDASGCIVRVFGTYQDISAELGAREALRRSEAWFRAIVDAAVDFILFVRRDGIVEFVNHVDSSGSIEDVVGRHVLDFWPKKETERIRGYFDAVFNHAQPATFEAEGGGDEQTLRWFRTSIGPVFAAGPGSEVVGATLIGTDISSLKHTEATLREQMATMRRLVGTVSTLERRVRRDVARVLHDDVQQLLVALKLKLDRVEGPSGPLADLVTTCLHKLANLATDLSPTIVHQANLDAALRWLMQRMHNTHGIVVHFESCNPPADLKTRELLFEAVRELLLNVIKHAGVLEARLVVRERAQTIEVEVSDAGSGFDTTLLGNTGGTGLGLCGLSDRLFATGGTLGIESSPGRGTTIVLRVPLPPAPVAKGDAQSSTRQISPPEDEGQRTRILLVDDHEMVRQGLAELLKREPDFVVVGEATNGIEAIAQARLLKPHVILMDVGLPLMGGEEATRIIMREQPDTKIIAISLHTESEMGRLLRQAGAVAFLSKSGPSATLCTMIRAVTTRPQP